LEDQLYSRILILSFPTEACNEPVVCYLTKKFNLTFAILHANIYPRKEGVMVLELSGEKEDYKAGVTYLKSRGIKVKHAAHEIIRLEEACTHCGACTAVCPTGALSIKRPEMRVEFDQDKCSACELCLPTCPAHAMKSNPTNDYFLDKDLFENG
jgi:ferredoxin